MRNEDQEHPLAFAIGGILAFLAAALATVAFVALCVGLIWWGFRFD